MRKIEWLTKLKVLSIVISFLVLTTGVDARTTGSGDRSRMQKIERTIAVDPSVTVSICLTSGSISVQGWDKDEVTARAGAGQLELKRIDAAGSSTPVKKLEVLANDKAAHKGPRDRCQTVSDLELNVPRNASVYVKTRDGDINIADVRMAIARSQNGDISITGVSHSVEAGSVGGSISLRDSIGRTSVTSVGGGIDAVNVRPLESADLFEAVSVSGDVILDGVSHAQLNAKTVTGNVHLTSSLAPGGRYDFKTMSGDVILTLPSSSSFSLSARISQDGEIVTDFPLTLLPEGSAPPAPAPELAPVSTTPPAPPESVSEPTPAPRVSPKPPVVIVNVSPSVSVNPAKRKVEVQAQGPIYSLRRVNAICGEGSTSISVASFSGTLHLQKKD